MGLGFQLDFDEAYGAVLVSQLQNTIGCFSCHAPQPSLSCTKCHIAQYCSNVCQWRHQRCGHHKEICQLWFDLRGNNNTAAATASSSTTTTDQEKSSSLSFDDSRAVIPICLRSCRFLSEDDLIVEMKHRSALFLQEVKRSSEQGDTLPLLSFQTAVEVTAGAIRLVAAASFYSTSHNRVLNIPHVLFENLDISINDNNSNNNSNNSNGQETVEEDQQRLQLYPAFGAGTISHHAKKQVIAVWSEFVQRMRTDYGLRVNGITYGRGLMWLAADDREGREAKRTIETSNGCRILWLPSMEFTSGKMTNFKKDPYTTASSNNLPRCVQEIVTKTRTVCLQK